MNVFTRVISPIHYSRQIHLWIRNEVKQGERRTPLIPKDVQSVVSSGHKVTVERSSTRIFPDSDYESIPGVKMVGTDSWKKDAPKDCFVLGLKELPEEIPLANKHIYFAHCYKGQSGSKELFERYEKGGGLILDLEFLVNEKNRRVCAFGHSAGYVGAALAIKQWALRKSSDEKTLPKLKPWLSDNELISDLNSLLDPVVSKVGNPKVAVLGPKGRVGSGSIDLLKKFKIQPKEWDRQETEKGGPFPELILDYDIMLNCIYLHSPISPFIDLNTINKFNKKRKLIVISDVSCDPTSPHNPIPLYTNSNTLDNPVTVVYPEKIEGEKKIPRIDLIGIDFLPTLLPKESSIDFSKQLLPIILQLEEYEKTSNVWKRAYDIFWKKSKSELKKE